MPDEPRVQELLAELFDRQATPEEVCDSCPELLPVVRERWRQICRLRTELDALLPICLNGSRQTVPQEELPLPKVPGYEVESVLGRGGMGVVYRARHLRLGRLVALKMALAGTYAGPHEQARFRREAEAVAALHHANVVQVYDVGDADGRPYFTMELMEGGSLARKLSGAPQPARQAAALLATLAGAVQAAHEASIVHRDLKPGNVLLAGDGTPKVADFGLARRLDQEGGLTRTGAALGTPSYMAPEQARGDKRAVGPATDVYALGAILYEMLTGRPPFRAETTAATLQQVMADDPVSPRRLNSSVPRDLETICLKCLNKEPRQRYAAAAELADDLRRFECGDPIAARRIGVIGSVRKWARRRPAAAAMLAAVALVAVTGVVGAGLLYRQLAHARARQDRTDQEVHTILGQARIRLDDGWKAADLEKLTEAHAEARHADEVARGGASGPVRQEAESFRVEAARLLAHAQANRALTDTLVDLIGPQHTKESARDDSGPWKSMAGRDLDKQYAEAFQHWGMDVDGAAEAEVAARLAAEPEPMVRELIAGLDAWMVLRRSQGRPEPEWRRLFRVADRLDGNERRRRLRAMLVADLPPSAATLAGLAGAGTSWPALWELTHGAAWRALREMRRAIDPRTEPALTVVLLARVLAAAGDVPEAEQVLRQAAVARPEQVVVLDAIGKVLERQGPARLAEAIGYYRAARSLRRHLGLALSGALLAAGRPAEAEEVLQDLVERQLDNPGVYFYLGTAAHDQSRYDEAQTAYQKAIDLSPDFAEAYGNLGNSLNAQQMYREAEAALRKAIDLKPGLAEAHNNLGNALMGCKRYSDAEVSYRKAIELRPGLAEAYNNLGTALDHQQRGAEAEAAYRKAIELRPYLASAYNNLGTALDRQQRGAEAEAAYRKAIELKPDYASAYYNLGVSLIERQRPAEAEVAFRKTIDLNPGMFEAKQSLGVALMQEARFDEAVAALKKASDLLPAKDPGRLQVWQLQLQCQGYAILDTRLPAILRGAEKPANAAEQLKYGQLCFLKKLHAAAARFFVDAFTKEPKLAQAVPAGARYTAACAAALASCGHGKDAADLDDVERARWRRQALEWLRLDLAWWNRALDENKGQAQVRARMQRWRSDGDLVGVRAHDALIRFPAEERNEWERFWTDVDALIRRASKPD
jgi:serine/threonine-protein kinase